MNRLFLTILFLIFINNTIYSIEKDFVCYVTKSSSEKRNLSVNEKSFTSFNEAISFLKKFNGGKNVQIILEEGLHFIDSTIIIHQIPQHLTIKSNSTNKAIISNGEEVKEYKLLDGNIISFPVKKEIFKLLINDENIPVASSLDKQNIQGLKQFSNFKEISNKKYSAKFPAEDIKKMEIGSYIFIYCKWLNYKLRIDSIDTKNRIVTMSGMFADIKYIGNNKDVYYSIYNSKSLLTPGTFCCIKNTIYYKLKDSQLHNLNSLQIRIPTLTTILKIEDCHQGIEINNVAFTNTTTDRLLRQERQASIEQPHSVIISKSSRILLQKCDFHHTFGYSLSICNNSFNCNVENCNFTDIEGGGIIIGDRKIEDSTNNIVLKENLIKSFGRINASCEGILSTRAHHIKIIQNTICDGYYTGITVGWTWGYKKSYSNNNYVANNHIHHLMQGLLSDGAGIYTLGIQKGTIIENNYIHDIVSRVYGSAGSSLIYFDEGTSNVISRNNICYGSHTGFHEHYGKNNKVENNLFAYTNLVSLRLSTPWRDSLLYISNNYLITDCGSYYDKGLAKNAIIKNNRTHSNKVILKEDGTKEINEKPNPLFLSTTPDENINSLYKAHLIKNKFSCGIKAQEQLIQSQLSVSFLNNHNKMVQALFPKHSNYFDRKY